MIDLHRRGVKRATAVRAQLWLEGKPNPTIDLVDDLVTEFKRIQKIVLRGITSNYDIRRYEFLSEIRQKKIVRQLGPLDSVFSDINFVLSDLAFLWGYEIARFGRPITPASDSDFSIEREIVTLRCDSGVYVLAGLLETEASEAPSAIFAIRSLTHDELEKCRSFSRVPSALFEMLQSISPTVDDQYSSPKYAEMIEKVVVSLRQWPWSILCFGAVANFIQNSRTKADSISG